MSSRINAVITQLLDRRLGHGPETMGLLSKAVMATNPSSSSKFSACFDPHGQPSLEHFKMYLQNISPPARIHMPLGLQRNHMTGLVIDIDAHGKSDVLFFNSLGSSDKGPYAREAHLFIDALREKFPKKNDYFVDKSYQNQRTGDNYCGDWTMWFLRKAATTPTQPLSELAAKFNHMPPSSIPRPQDLRQEHIQILAQHNRLLAAPRADVAPVTTPSVVPSPKRKIRNEIEAKTYLESCLK